MSDPAMPRRGHSQSYGLPCSCHPSAMGHFFHGLSLRCRNHTPKGLQVCRVSWFDHQDDPQPCRFPVDPRFGPKEEKEEAA